jgi:dUTP pyrophosphatase
MKVIHRQHLLLNPRVKFLKTHPGAQLPKANNSEIGTGDSGYDLTAVEDVTIYAGWDAVVPVGLTLAYVEEGFWFRIEPRSGLGFKNSIQPHLGVIDNGYRGDLGVKLYNFGNEAHQVKKGDRIAQFVVYPLIHPQCEWADKIIESDRGADGFGSSGK